MVGAAKVVVCPLRVLRGPNIMSSVTWGPGHFRLQGLCIFPYPLPSAYLSSDMGPWPLLSSGSLHFYLPPAFCISVFPYSFNFDLVSALSYFNYFYFHLFVSFS